MMKSDTAGHTGVAAWDTKRSAAWVLLVLSLPLAIVATALMYPALSHLADALLVFLNGPAEPSLFQDALVRMVFSSGVPTALVFGVLSLTRMGTWLVPNRLTVGLLLLFDVLFLAMGAYLLYMASLGNWPYQSREVRKLIEPWLTASLCAGLGMLAVSTIWRRTAWSGKRHAVNGARWLWREV